ncbi:MAG: SinI family restriction endonuclease [Gammaproteobacteria bacterium]
MNRELIEQAASEAMQKFNGKEPDKRAFVTIMEFVDQFPDRVSWRRGVKPDTGALDYYTRLADKFFRTRYKVEGPKAPTTEPDSMVSYILEVYFDYSEVDTQRVKVEHQLSMAVENMVGALLERYIGMTLEAHGWVWCSGDFIKAVDMIKKKNDGTWLLLQVKNRNNTENSSSSAIRVGTEIKKWFRSFSKKSTTNWEAFPDEETRHLLSEDGFKAFVKAYLLSAKNTNKK